MEPAASSGETAGVVVLVGDVQRQLDLVFPVVDDVRRVAGALGVGGGLGLDGLVRVLGLVRREGHGHSPIENHVAIEGGGHLALGCVGVRDDLGLDTWL